MIVLDPSAVAALLDPRAPAHRRARAALEQAREPTVVPAAALDRIAHVASDLAGPRAARTFLRGVVEGETLLDCGDLDLPRILDLLGRFEDIPIDLATAAVVACAERHDGAVLSFDERLNAVAGEGLIRLVG
jgi:predicted nucleic acid-binding protein